VEASKARKDRRQGQKRLATAAAAGQAVDASSARTRGVDIVQSGGQAVGHEEPKRRYGPRPAQPLRPPSVQGEARLEQAALAQVVRRLGWRVAATNHAQELRRKQVGAADWRADLVEPGRRRLPGPLVARTPLSLQCEQRSVRLLFLRRLALRVLVLMQLVAREKLQRAGTTRKGIYPGPPGRQTTRPTAEMMLPVWRGSTWSRMTVNGETYEHLTPLTPVQARIIELIGIPLETFSRLAPQLSKTAFHSHEP
jgi:hypothetical protein